VHKAARSRLSTTRRGSPSYIPRTNFRVTALLVCATPTHGPWLRSRLIWRNLASGFPNCADSTLLMNMAGEQSDSGVTMMHKISSTRLRLQIVACPADTGNNLCLIAANRTPCRRNPRTRLQSHTRGLLLPQQSVHPSRSPSQCNRTCSYKPTATAHASVCNPTLQRTSTQLTQVARPEPLLNISMIELFPVKRINARMPVPMRLS